jgi:hypothetical protein
MDSLNDFARGWERRSSSQGHGQAARTTLAKLLSDPGASSTLRDDGQPPCETGRCVLVVTPQEFAALGVAVEPALETLFGLFAVEIEHDGGVVFDPLEIAKASVVTTDIVRLVEFIGDSPIWLFDRSAQGLLTAAFAKAGAAFADGRVRLLAERAATAGEVATHDLRTLGSEGGASLDLPPSSEAVTPATVCAWMAETVASVLDIERQKLLFTDSVHPSFGGDDLAKDARTAAQKLPSDHRAAAAEVLRILLPPTA